MTHPFDPRRVAAFDLETHLVQDGLAAPPGVCGSWATLDTPPRMDVFPAALDILEWLLDTDRVIAGANIAFDFAVACAEPEGGRWKGRPDLLPLVFEKYERGEVWDVLIAAALDAIAQGCLFRDPRTGAPIQYLKPDGSPGKRAKRYSLEIVSRLVLGKHNAKENDEYRKSYFDLEHLPLDMWPAIARQYPMDDARNTLDVAIEQMFGLRAAENCGPLQRHPWSHMTHQARYAWAVHLASTHGFRTEAARVEKLAAEVDAKYAADRETFKNSGILRPNGKKDTAALKRLVIKAYGGGEPCGTCQGSGKVPSPKNPKSKINCKTCGGAGLALPEALPLTDGGGVSTSRDTLAESGDDLLEAFAQVSETEKLRGTYIPFLKTGTRVPINVKSNVTVESGRASYDGLIQLLPRNGGIRETIVARRREFIPDLPEGFEDRVLNSVDYSAVELCTLAQVCLWVVGESRMADVINAAKDPGALHTHMGAKLINASPEEFAARVKAEDKHAGNMRQAAKAANFGFPGGMGAAKLTIAKRKEGLRFCIVSGRAQPCESCGGKTGLQCRRCYGRGFLCGLEKAVEWNDRPIPPTCIACIEYAQELKREWFDLWPEVREYFEWVKSHDGCEDGIATTISPGSGWVRGNMNFSSLANNGFQHLAAMGAKHAMWKVSKECYTDRASPLYGGRPLIFAHDEIITELIESRAHEAAYRQAEIQIAAMREFVPDVHIAAEPAIMRRWYKEAKLVKGADGRLVCWEPKSKAKA